MRKDRGFTLIELMIVIAIITIIALIAIPNLLGSRMVANETSTICSLRTLALAQAEFRARRIIDQDANGIGEYGFLQELAGTVIPRGWTLLLDPPSISSALGNVDANGLVTKSGYAYVFFLPGGGGVEIREPAAGVGPAANPADAREQETRWCCYAIPMTIRNTGNRAFVVNHEAAVFGTANSGVQNYDVANLAALVANPNAAFAAGVVNINGRFATGVGAAQDGGTWTPAS
jgi:prepilin-type N-terminal cleavage/methylation domain-containing protein